MLFFFIISSGIKAHNPDLSSTLLIEQQENKWILQIRAALTAFEYEVEKHYGKDAYTSPEEFQGLVTELVAKNAAVLFNKTEGLALENGIVKLGHETSVTFSLAGAPSNIQTLAVKNSSFSDIPRNQSALIILKKGFSKDQFVLNNKNQHSMELKIKDAKFVAITPIQKGNQNYLFLIAVFMCLVIGASSIYLISRNRKPLSFLTLPSMNKNLNYE